MSMSSRQELDLFANVVRIHSLEGFQTKHDNLDFVIIRESTEGEYSCLEHEVLDEELIWTTLCSDTHSIQ